MAVGARRRAFRDYTLACEAAVSLVKARLALSILSFPRIIRASTRAVRHPSTGQARDRAIRDVRWAVAAAAARLPGTTVCLPRALSAQAMLRRRGVASTLTCGARTRDAHFDAHAWLTAGADAIVGHDVADQYCDVSRYSNAQDKESRA